MHDLFSVSSQSLCHMNTLYKLHMSNGYLSHRRLAKTHASLCIKATSLEHCCSQTCRRDLEEAKKHTSVAQI